MSKCGAIFEVSAALVVQGLKAIAALPADAECEVNYGPGGEGAVVLVKCRSDLLPVVPEGAVYPRFKAVAGCPVGEK